MVEKNSGTSEERSFTDRVLDELPPKCVSRRDRLCSRISTTLARSEWAHTIGKSDEVIFNTHVYPAAEAIGKRCLAGNYVDDDNRSNCGLYTDSHDIPGISKK